MKPWQRVWELIGIVEVTTADVDQWRPRILAEQPD
jgi:hypothetical protein